MKFWTFTALAIATHALARQQDLGLVRFMNEWVALLFTVRAGVHLWRNE